MNVLAIDIGGTHVKLLVTGKKTHSEFASSPELTPAMLLPPQPSPFSVSANTLSQALYDLISQQPFFKGLNSHQLQLLADSALEMTALN